MSLRASDVLPISEARARLTELADDVVRHGAEKLLTKMGQATPRWSMPVSWTITTRSRLSTQGWCSFEARSRVWKT